MATQVEVHFLAWQLLSTINPAGVAESITRYAHSHHVLFEALVFAFVDVFSKCVFPSIHAVP